MCLLCIAGRSETGSKEGSSSGGTGYPDEGTGTAAERGMSVLGGGGILILQPGNMLV